MHKAEVLRRCAKKTETVCFVSGRRFRIADLGLGVTEIPHMQHLLHPAVSAAMTEEERQAAYDKILPKERELLKAERDRFIAMDEAESRAAAERAAAELAALPAPDNPPV